METYIFGIFPRSMRLIAATRRDPEKARDLARIEGKRLIRTQKKSGITIVSDPLLDWDDMLRWFAVEWGGVEINGINRFFEHNTFYRVPVIVGNLSTDGETLRKHVDLEELKSNGRFLIEIPEPVTFAVLSKDKYYGSLERLAERIAETLNEEIFGVLKFGKPELIVVKGPALVHKAPDTLIELAAKVSRRLLESCSVPAMLHLYFKNPIPVFRKISALKSAYTGFGLDLTQVDFSVVEELAKEYSGCLALGIIDSHNTKLEKIRDIKKITEKISERKCVYATNSSDMEFLPYSFAVKKMKILGRVSGL